MVQPYCDYTKGAVASTGAGKESALHAAWYVPLSDQHNSELNEHICWPCLGLKGAADVQTSVQQPPCHGGQPQRSTLQSLTQQQIALWWLHGLLGAA